MSPSSPYIYNPKECVILAYKKQHIKKIKGQPQWTNEWIDVEDENGVTKQKKVYTEDQKREFIDLVFGQWNYFADTKSMTKATFSMDIPTKAIKILTYKNDVVLDPFAGSGTVGKIAKQINRKYILIEKESKYTDLISKRINENQ